MLTAGPWATRLFVVGLLVCSGPAQAVELVVKGVDDDLARNIRTLVGLPLDDTPTQIRRYVRKAPSLAGQALKAVGYYNAKFEVTSSGTPTTPIVTINVDKGRPVTNTAIIIVVNGPGRLDSGFMPSIGRIPIRKNAVFTHSDYESTKTLLFNAALARGYFDFRYTKRDVKISREKNTAEIRLEMDTGLRYTFATVEFKTDYFTPEYLRTYLPFEFGDEFDSAKLAELTRNMQNTGYFKSVKVTPLRGEAYGKQVPVIVEVARRDRNYMGIGIGFATDTLWRTKFTWSKPAINRRGHSFDSEIGLSAVEQKASFQYRIPRSGDPINNYWSVEYGLLNQETDDDTGSLLSTLNLQHVRKTGNDWRESIFIRWEHERSTVAGVEDQTNLLLPGFSYSKSRAVGWPFTTRGYSAQFTFMAGSRKALSDIDFYKSTLNYKWLHSFTENTTLILGLQYGAIEASDFDRVPVSHRFFAGGDRSVRGFGYRSISPTNEDGDLVGGRFLEVSSIEWSYRITEKWAVAVFSDAGRAFNSFDQRYSVGAGVGLRWYSPVGPFRIDLASDISEDNPGFTLHLSLGPDL